MTEADRQRMQDAFENSDLYFKGESPETRALNWKIWVMAWKAARANPRQTEDLSETGHENLDCMIVNIARQHATRDDQRGRENTYQWTFENHNVFRFAYTLLNMRIPGDPKQEKKDGS